MNRTSCICVKLLMLVFVILSIGCKKNTNGVVAVIEGKDTITIAQFKERLTRIYGEKTKSLTYSEKRIALEELVKERLRLIYASENQDSNVIHPDIESKKKTVLLNKAYEKYILNHFIDEQFVRRYRLYFGKTIQLQNLVLPYHADNTPQVKLSKSDARKRIDSIYANTDVRNFSSFIEEFSDYKDPKTRKGNTVAERMKFGSMPYNIEKEILNTKKNSISRPVDIQWAFVIFRLIPTEDSTRDKKSENEIRDHLKTKLMDDDYPTVLAFQNQFLDSLYESAQVMISEENIGYMLNIIEDSTEIYSAVNRFSEQESDKVLVKLPVGQITIRDYLTKYSPGITGKLSREAVVSDLVTLTKKELFGTFSINDGFLESDEFKSAVTSLIDQEKLGRAAQLIVNEASKAVRVTPESYYKKNRNNFRTEGSIVLSEIHSTSKEEIETCLNMIETGVDFEKVTFMISSKNRRASVKLNSNLSLNYGSRDELASKARSMKKNEISDIIMRLTGGFSIIKIIDKKEPAFLSYDKVSMRIQNNLAEYQVKNFEDSLLYKLKKRWRLVIYENNLNGDLEP